MKYVVLVFVFRANGSAKKEALAKSIILQADQADEALDLPICYKRLVGAAEEVEVKVKDSS